MERKDHSDGGTGIVSVLSRIERLLEPTWQRVELAAQAGADAAGVAGLGKHLATPPHDDRQRAEAHSRQDKVEHEVQAGHLSRLPDFDGKGAAVRAPSCRFSRVRANRRLPSASLDRCDVRLQRLQRGRSRVPVVAFQPRKGVAMQTGRVSQVYGGDAFLPKGGADALDEVCNHADLKSTFACALQAQKHSLKCFSSVTRRRMDKTPDEKRAILRAFIKDRNSTGDEKFNVQRWAKAAAISKNTLYNFLNDHNDALDHQTYLKLARAAGVPVHTLTGEPPDLPQPSGIPVSGYIEAGSYRAAIEWDSDRWYVVDVPVPPRFQSKAKALEVRGPSMDKEYPEGSIVVWVDQLDFRAPHQGDHVIVYAYSHDDEIEATVKELRVVDGQEWLWPLSHHPDHQQPLNPRIPPDHVKRVEVQGIVLGGYKPRVH